MSRPSHLRAVLLAATVLAPLVFAPVAAHADDVTAEQAAQLQTQLRAWLINLVGPKVPLSAAPIRVTPRGDHFELAVDVSGAIKNTPITIVAGPFTALVKPLDGGLWQVDSLALPSPFRIENSDPDPKLDFKSITLTSKEQSYKGVFDPTLASAMTFDSTLNGYSSVTEREAGPRTSTIDSSTTRTTMTPTANRRVNLVIAGTGDKFVTDSSLPDGGTMNFKGQKISIGGHMDEVAFDEVGAMVRAVVDLIDAKPAPKPHVANPTIVADAKAALARGMKPGATPRPKPETVADDKPVNLTPEQKRAAHGLLASLRGFTSGMDEQFGMDGVAIDASGHAVSFGKMAFRFGFGAPGGRMETHLAMTMDGLAVPEIPAGPMRDYLPTHIALTPRVSGIPVKDAFALLDHAIDIDDPAGDRITPEDGMALLAKGPLVMGVDGLELDMGPAKLRGAGEASLTNPTDVKGHAQFSMTGLDEIIKQAGTDPQLKQFGAGPALFLVKGMGRVEGEKTVWDVTYEAGKFLVNGQDLSAMIPNH